MRFSPEFAGLLALTSPAERGTPTSRLGCDGGLCIRSSSLSWSALADRKVKRRSSGQRWLRTLEVVGLDLLKREDGVGCFMIFSSSSP